MENIIKHAGGRPPLWTDPKELETIIDNYFDSITRYKIKTEPIEVGLDDRGKPVYEDQPVLDQNGNQVKELQWLDVPTFSGLALKIGCDRATLTQYQYKDQFSSTLKSAKQRIEGYLEKRLDERPAAAGTIFALKNNNNWKDTTEIGITGSLQTTNYDISEMDPSDKASLLALLSKLNEKTAAEPEEITG